MHDIDYNVGDVTCDPIYQVRVIDILAISNMCATESIRNAVCTIRYTNLTFFCIIDST